MSVRQLAKVWEYQFSKGEQSIMLSMADHANDEGGSIFPSVARIAWKTDYSKRQVQRIISALVDHRILVLVRKETRRRPREYRISWKHADKKPAFRGDTMSKSGVTSEGKRGDISDVRGDITVSPRTIIKPSLIEPPKEKVVVNRNSIIRALFEAGIEGQKIQQQLLEKKHMTPEYIKAHSAYAKRNGVDLGLLIHKIRSGDPMPERGGHQQGCNCEQCRQRYTTGEYSGSIES